MSDFGDIERFARSHAACGGITPNATTQMGGGYLLTLTCACGGAMDRWIDAEEAKLPLPLIAPTAGAAPPAAPRAPAPDKPKAPAPSTDLQEALRHALEAEDKADAAPPAAKGPLSPPPSPRVPITNLDEAVQRALEADARAATEAAAPPARPRERAVQPRLNLDAAVQRAVDSQAVQRVAARPSTSRFWFGAVVMLLVVGGAVFWFGLQALEEDARLGTREAEVSSAPPPASAVERAAFAEALRALQDVQAASTPTVPYPVYSSRVAFAKADVDRYLGTEGAPALKTDVRDTMELHVLASAAWRARSMDSKEAWEALGRDPAIDLCPSARRVIDFAETPANQSQAYARGLGVAGAIPLLWECAGERLNALEGASSG